MLDINKVSISKSLKDKQILYQNMNHKDIISPSWSIEKMVQNSYDLQCISRQLQTLIHECSLTQGHRVLEIGCGMGYFSLVTLLNGYNYWGCDVIPGAVSLAKELLTENHLDSERVCFVSSQSKLPYPDDSFDIIYLYHVIEHVENLDFLMQEMHRILKNNGQIYLEAPNYLCFYEVHYSLPIVPFLPKKWLIYYLKWMGRKNTNFLFTLNFVTPQRVKKLCNKYHFSCEEIGRKRWREFLRGNDFEGRSGILKKIMTHRFGSLFKKMLLFVASLGVYNPLVFKITKAK